jgi:GR25 family glycosyltransferase involved in LPS biosynthesis
MPFPFLVTHYKGNVDRRRYIENVFASSTIRPEFITEFDREELSLNEVYRFDDALFRKMVEPIKDVLIGYVIGLRDERSAPWTNCVSDQKRQKRPLDLDFQTWEWLRPRALNAAEISIFLKHRAAWQCIANGAAEWGLIAEDDILLQNGSLEYLLDLSTRLPDGFDYIDLAGGCGLLPRMGNPVVNEVFFAIDPPRDRTACCALMTRDFAKRLLQMELPIIMPLDWTLTYAFVQASAKVYWIHPPVFIHGSETNVYGSGTQEWQRHPGTGRFRSIIAAVLERAHFQTKFRSKNPG